MGDTRPSILLVDDEEIIINLLKEYLESIGYQVTAVTSAEDAVKYLNNGINIDLILSDINLPGMTGIDLLKIARETKPDVSVVLITGFKTLDYAISAIKNGAQDYITKPFDLVNVRRIVEKVIRKRSKDQQKRRVLEFGQYLKMNFSIPTGEIDPGVVADYFANLLLQTGFCDENEYNQYNLAFTEALINAVEHGSLELSSDIKENDFEKLALFEELKSRRIKDPKYANRKIEIAFEYRPELFVLNITDEGPGFNWRKFVDDHHRFREVNTEAHGRGFMIIKHIVDEVYFNDKGNSITIIKHKKPVE